MPLLPEPDPYDEQALITGLGGRVPPEPPPPLPPEVLAALVKALKPQSSRDVLESVDPQANGPTRGRAPQGGAMDRVRSLLAEQQIERDKQAPHPNLRVGPPETAPQTTPKSTVAGVGGAIPAALSGVLGALMDNPRDVGGAVKEGAARAGVAPFQESPPSISGELKAHGHDPGPVGSFAIDVAAPDIGDAGALAPLAGLAMGGLKKVGKAATGEALEGVLGKVLKTKKAAPFEFAALDAKALARQEAFKSGEINMRSLPKEAQPTAIHQALQKLDDGYSVQPLTGQRVKVGEPGPAMVGVYPNSDNRTKVIPLKDFTPKHVAQFLRDNADTFAKKTDAFAGGWVGKDDAGNINVYLDVARGHLTKEGAPDLRAATKMGELQNPGTVRGKATGVVRDPVTGKWPKGQEAIFDPSAPPESRYPPVGNLHEFLNSEEFQSRVHEMAEVGRKAMGGENPEWWDIVNGPMARVYGKENVEALAGYIASTSPQNGPVANMKMATEFMRRHLKDEAMRQPDWRAPADAMGKVGSGGAVSEGFAPKAGAKFPNEGTYAGNAERVRAGTPEKVQDDKVNDMFHALMGKLVGVFDRHWAKLAEKPSAGIYADAVQNRLAGSMSSGVVDAYPLVENAVRTAAKNAGVDLSKYSAWVWEGIRDTIRTTGKLYGQTHRASAIPETTTGFNEIFEHLVQEKAKHLGVSVEVLEQKLRSGDAELLGLILATPIGAAAFSQWQSQAGGGGAPSPSKTGT